MPGSSATTDDLVDLRQALAIHPGQSPHEVVALVVRDQESRWRRGERVLIETYLDAHPHLSAHDALLDLIYSEIMLRETLGDRPKLEEYGFRFPQIIESVRSLFQLHHALTPASLATPVIRLKSQATAPTGDRLKAVNPAIGFELPGFDLLEEIGRGGMGVVYKARQTELNRIVAVKMLRSDGIDSEWSVRLRREAEAIAQIQHPNIVQVFEVGTYQNQPFLVLEYVAGGTLADRLRAGPLPAREAAQLLRIVALAIQAAHDRNIIHRDLKPGNILLPIDEKKLNAETPPPQGKGGPRNSSAIRDSQPQPKVTDFGLSKRLDQSALSHTGELIGTPNYMAPEQASGGKHIGPAADVYALGAILFECLTGRPPFIGDNPMSVLLQVTKDEPLAPTRLRSGIPRDLESVCLKCLEKNPQRRFGSARELADDLDRYLAGQSTTARPLSTIGKAVKLVRRYPVPFTLASLFVGSLLIGLIGVLWQWRAAVGARQDEAAQRTIAEQNLYYARLAQAVALWDNGDSIRAREILNECHPHSGHRDWRHWEWRHLQRMFHLEARIIQFTHWVHGVSILNAASDGSLSLAYAEGRPQFTLGQKPEPGDGRAGWIEAPLAAPLHWQAGPELPSAATAIAVDSTRERFAWGTSNGTLIVCDRQGRVSFAKKMPTAIYQVAILPDGQEIIVSMVIGEHHDLAFVNPTTGQIRELKKTGVGRPGVIVVAPNGQWLAVGGATGRVRILNVADFSVRHDFRLLDDGGITALCLSPNGDTLVIGTGRGSMVAWDTAKKTEVRRWNAHTGPIYALATSVDGSTLVSGGADNSVRLWDARSGQLRWVTRGHEATIRCAAFSPDGRWIATGGQDKTIRIWDRTLDPRGLRVPFHPRLNDMALVDSPGGLVVRAVALTGRVQSFAADDGAPTPPVTVALGHRPSYPVRYATFLGPDRHVVAIDRDDPQTLKQFHGETGELLRTWPKAAGPITAVATDVDGRWLTWAAIVDGKSAVYWWNEDQQQLGGPVLVDAPSIRALAISANGRWIASQANPRPTTPECSAWVIDTTKAESVRQLANSQLTHGAMAFRPDSGELAITVENSLRAYSTTTWTTNFIFPCDRATTCVNYSSDGRRLALVGYSGVVTLVDPSNGKRVFSLKGLAPGRPEDMACDARVMFSRDGRWLVSTNWDGSINIWDSLPVDAANDLAETNAISK